METVLEQKGEIVDAIKDDYCAKHVGGSFKIVHNHNTKCAKCGSPMVLDEAIEELADGTSCHKCVHAYFCYLLMHESRKAAYQKNEQAKQIADNQGQLCANEFKMRYEQDWRSYLHQIFPEFEMRLSNGLQEKINISQLVTEAKYKKLI